MTENTIDGQIVHGHVKWFDPVKGFGFIVSDEGGQDILLHANVLRNFGQSSIAEGAIIEIEAHATDRGIQALQILSIAAQPDDRTTDFNGGDLSAAQNAPLVPARVKWFDKAKGFGFANVFGSTEDVFVHVEVLRLAGLADLQPGEAVVLQVVSGERGQMAATVVSWDTASETMDKPK